jgi:hypothetical protein
MIFKEYLKRSLLKGKSALTKELLIVNKETEQKQNLTSWVVVYHT